MPKKLNIEQSLEDGLCFEGDVCKKHKSQTRYTSSGVCVECQLEWSAKAAEKKRAARFNIHVGDKISYSDARRMGMKKYSASEICEKCQTLSDRYTSNKCCIECQKRERAKDKTQFGRMIDVGGRKVFMSPERAKQILPQARFIAGKCDSGSE